MGLFDLFKRDKTPPPLYMHGDSNSPNCFLSPTLSATDPSRKDHRRRRSHYKIIPELQQLFFSCRNPRDAYALGPEGHGLLDDLYDVYQRGPEDAYAGYQQVPDDAYNTYHRGLRPTSEGRRFSVRTDVSRELSAAQAHRRETMYSREGCEGFEQNARFDSGERDGELSYGYPGSEGAGGRGYAPSLGAGAASERGMLEAGYGGEEGRGEEEERSRVGVFGVANLGYGAGYGQGRKEFRGGWMGSGRKGFYASTEAI